MKMVSENDTSLSHFGVTGMKWGKRKSSGNWIKEAGTMVKNQTLHPRITKSADKESKKADTMDSRVRRNMLYQNTKELKDVNSRVDAKVTENVNKTKSAVQKYSKEFDKMSKAEAAADKKWNDVDNLYKQTGKNTVSRIINNMKGKSEAVQKYSKEYDKAEKASAAVDEQWNKTKKLYEQTGKNKISRIINNIKYN